LTVVPIIGVRAVREAVEQMSIQVPRLELLRDCLQLVKAALNGRRGGLWRRSSLFAKCALMIGSAGRRSQYKTIFTLETTISWVSLRAVPGDCGFGGAVVGFSGNNGAQAIAFPGAYGFGESATGGHGGAIPCGQWVAGLVERQSYDGGTDNSGRRHRHYGR
jgi:hypothetical protein